MKSTQLKDFTSQDAHLQHEHPPAVPLQPRGRFAKAAQAGEVTSFSAAISEQAAKGAVPSYTIVMVPKSM
eukprot:4534756-Karenia_brevis.AAC.1